MLGDIDEKVAEKTEGCQHVNVALSKGIVKINKPILFKSGESEFLDDREAWDILNDVAVAIKAIDETFRTEGLEMPGDAFEIGGHTNWFKAYGVEDTQKSQQLSDSRASVCRKYLLEQGCRGDMLTAKGYGSTKPKSNVDAALNLRVEITFQRADVVVAKIKEMKAVSSGIETTDAADLDIVDDYNPFVDDNQPNDGK